MYITVTYILPIFRKSNESNEYTLVLIHSLNLTHLDNIFSKIKRYPNKVLGKKSKSERSLLDSTLWNFLDKITWAEIQVLRQGVAALRNRHKFFVLFVVFCPSS